MTRDLLLGYASLLLCAAIAVVDPARRWQLSRRRRARAAARADVSTAATPVPASPAPSPGCSACEQGEVVAFQPLLPAAEVQRINALLQWHWRSKRPEVRV